MKVWTQRRRRHVAWLCAVIALWMPWDAQLHRLWHARQEVQAAVSHADAPTLAALACEQCLLLSALDGALPTGAAAVPCVGPAPAAAPCVVARRHAAPFIAYRTRAPPRRA